ncbi:MAG TPA: hybrid sensor histidine kinase/response regulator [Acidimicrobiales bacterium]|nr:hybrid sensor histidine kinase/response regulator [Acidimicrobiales bacterium]
MTFDVVTSDGAVRADGQLAARVASVLVVDDDVDHRELISRRLTSVGMRVTPVATADEALAALGGVDLVLLDYKLGGRDGLEVLGQIRSLPAPPAVIMVTGMGSEQVVIACMRAGASDYVVKDSGYLRNLPTVVERAWRHHDLERRARELERLALLVTSAPDRDGALHEIVAGALRLLAADECEVQLAEEAGARAVAGEVSLELRVPITLPETGRLGDLVVRRRSGGPFTDEETRLGSTFASFAAIAIAKLRQLELERSLVAELQHTLDMRRQLVAGVSHELRTPLTAISGFAQTILNHWDRIAEADRKDMIARIRANAAELGALVEQLLDFASVEAGRLRVDVGVIDLEPEAREAVADLAPVLADRTIVIDVPTGLTARADAGILRRLLTNLLTNAAKYTPQSAAIAVRAVTVDDSERVRMEVADTGDGLSSEELERVFEPFWRAEATRNSRRGTGIGLALVRDYARLMGGEAGVDSAPGEGATFWFTLPR